MAATGYTPISLYYTTVSGRPVPAGTLVPGELALNAADGTLFYYNTTSTSIQPLTVGTATTATNLAGGVALGVPFQTGAGATTFTAAPTVSGQVLTYNGTTLTWATAGTSGVSSFSAGTTGLTPNSATTGAVTLDGTLAVANGGTGVTSSTGTTAVVLSVTPTITALYEVKVAIAASNIDLATGNYFSKTISGNTTFTVSNTPATSTAASFILDLTNGGSATITWWSGVTWAGGTPPTLTAAGRDVLGFYTYDNGTTWTGLVLAKDVK